MENSSNQSAIKAHPLIPLSYVLVIIMFFFSFFDVKCKDDKGKNQTLFSVTGGDLVKGKDLTIDYSQKDLVANAESSEIKPNPFAITALIAAIFGIMVFIIRNKRTKLLSLIFGLFGLAAIILLKLTIRKMLNDSGGDVDDKTIIEFQPAYWIALSAFVVAVFLSFLLKNTKKEEGLN